jgi:hypothetical protein
MLTCSRIKPLPPSSVDLLPCKAQKSGPQIPTDAAAARRRSDPQPLIYVKLPIYSHLAFGPGIRNHCQSRNGWCPYASLGCGVVLEFALSNHMGCADLNFKCDIILTGTKSRLQPQRHVSDDDPRSYQSQY